MRDRVKELHYEYCVPKPKRFFHLWDSAVSKPDADDSEQARFEKESIDCYVHLVV